MTCADDETDFSDGAKDDKGKPILSAGLLGFVSSCYQLGSIIGVPIAPWFNQRFGRRWAIMTGSIIMVIGAIIQGFAQNRELVFCSLFLQASRARGRNPC